MTYSFVNPEHTYLVGPDGKGGTCGFGWESGTPAWELFVESGEEPLPYVEPPEPPEPTTTEKVNNLLSDYGLTRAELRVVFEATEEEVINTADESND